MGDSARDTIAELCALLDEAGATVTFSAHCRTGLIGEDACRCWRCRGERGPTADERAAKRDAMIADRAYRAGIAMGQAMERMRQRQREEE